MNSATTNSEHIRHEILVSGISNTVFNGLFAWLLLKDGPNLDWGSEHSFVVDVVATGFLLPMIVALIVIPLQRGKLNKGKLQPINLGTSSSLQAFADRFPASAFKSSLLFGLVGMLIIAPLTLLAFYLLGVEQVSPLQYALFKGLWAGLIAAILVVPMVLIALRAPQPTL
ncbi:MAG: hypothetical protein R3E64_15105 [Halioglobus sp.]